MNELKLYLLKIINSINNSEPVSIPGIDMRVTRKFTDVISKGLLKTNLIDLTQDGYINWVDDVTVQITDDGKSNLLQ